MDNMPYILNYLPILLFGAIISGLAILMISLPFILAPRRRYASKLTTYECGFDPFENKSSRFDIRFYLTSILFIVFDIEIILLAPWAIHLHELGMVAFIGAMMFIFLLLVGLIYEWRKEAMDW